MTCGFKLKVAYYRGLLQPQRNSEAGRNPPKNVADFKARFEDLFHGCRRLSTHGCGASCLYTSGTGGQDFFFFFNVIRFFFFPMYISPGLRGENRVTGGAILAAAALIVCIHAEREGVKFILVCFNIFFLPHVHFSRATGGEPGCRRLSTHGCGGFDSHTTSGTRGWGTCFGVFQQCYSMFPGYGGGTRLPAALYSRMRRF